VAAAVVVVVGQLADFHLSDSLVVASWRAVVVVVAEIVEQEFVGVVETFAAVVVVASALVLAVEMAVAEIDLAAAVVVVVVVKVASQEPQLSSLRASMAAAVVAAQPPIFEAAVAETPTGRPSSSFEEQ
jgi:hypothetical protein